MQLAHQAVFSLGVLEVRPSTCEVLSPNICEVLQPRVMQVLVVLARAQGAVVSRDDLIATCWGGRIVSEDAITLVMSKLRKLAERSGGAFAVETVPRVGYRLTIPAGAIAPLVPNTRARARPRLVVREFAHAPGEVEHGWFAEALADELTAGLSKSPLLSVTPRQTLVFAEVAGQSPASVCGRLGVDYLLDGKVRTLGGTVRVSVDLIQGADESGMWSARYDRPVAGLFSMLDEITRSIIGAVEPAVLELEESLATKTPEHSLEFWRLFVEGRRRFWRSTPDDVRMAEVLLEQALAIEPNDVSALSILAHCKLYDLWSGTAANPAAQLAEAHRIALNAVSEDGSDAFAHFTLGVVLSMMGRLPEAKAEQRRALELNPYLAAASGEMGRLLAFEGLAKEAIAFSERAIAASPNDPQTWLWYRAKAIARFVDGDYSAAARDAADASARKPQRFSLRYLLAACYSAAGAMPQARQALAEGDRLASEQHGGEGPAYSLDALKIGHPFVRPQDLERFVKALSAVGWEGR